MYIEGIKVTTGIFADQLTRYPHYDESPEEKKSTSLMRARAASHAVAALGSAAATCGYVGIAHLAQAGDAPADWDVAADLNRWALEQERSTAGCEPAAPADVTDKGDHRSFQADAPLRLQWESAWARAVALRSLLLKRHPRGNRVRACRCSVQRRSCSRASSRASPPKRWKPPGRLSIPAHTWAVQP